MILKFNMDINDVKKQHPTATVEQVKDNQLFFITYPRLILAVSYNTLIAFCFADDWHITLGKHSKTTTKHQYHLLDLVTIKHWHKTRKDMLAALNEVLDTITDPNS